MNDLLSLAPVLQDLVADLEKTVPYAAAWAQEVSGERLVLDRREARVEALEQQAGVVLTVFTGRFFLELPLMVFKVQIFAAGCRKGPRTWCRRRCGKELWIWVSTRIPVLRPNRILPFQN